MEKGYLHISFNDFVFVYLRGIIWSTSGLSQPSNLDKLTCEQLRIIYESIDTTKLLVIDCKGVNSITDHALDVLFKSISQHQREIAFINYQQIEERLASAKKEFCEGFNVTNCDHHFSIYKMNLKKEFTTDDSAVLAKQIIQNIQNFISQSFQKFSNPNFKRLSSTPILASGEYDASILISNPASFYWITITLLEKVESIIQEYQIGKQNSPAKLLSVSLRGAPFASAIGLLGGFQVECIDHLGPINPYVKFDDNEVSKSEYVYIGDFVFGGTEIKVSKNYVHLKESILNHAVSVGSLFPTETFKDFDLHSLVILSDIDKQAQYKLFES